MSPALFLLLMLGITAAAATGQRGVRWRRGRALRALARDRRMHYSARDRFRLADRVAGHFPLCGAADVRVSDLIYGIDEDQYRYVFTVDYTQGVIRTKQRMRRVGSFCEPRSGSASGEESTFPLRLADEAGSVMEQYRQLLPGVSGAMN